METTSLSGQIDWIPLTTAATLLPKRAGKKLHVVTIKRWIIKGCNGVRLAGQKVGGTWYTTVANLLEFQAACTAKAIAQEGQSAPIDARMDAAISRERMYERGLLKRPRAVPPMPTTAESLASLSTTPVMGAVT